MEDSDNEQDKSIDLSASCYRRHKKTVIEVIGLRLLFCFTNFASSRGISQ